MVDDSEKVFTFSHCAVDGLFHCPDCDCNTDWTGKTIGKVDRKCLALTRAIVDGRFVMQPFDDAIKEH